MIQSSLQGISRATGRAGGRTDRLAGRLKAMLDYAHMDDLQAGDAHSYLRDVHRLCNEIHAAIGQTYIAPRHIPSGQAQVYPPPRCAVRDDRSVGSRDYSCAMQSNT